MSNEEASTVTTSMPGASPRSAVEGGAQVLARFWPLILVAVVAAAPLVASNNYIIALGNLIMINAVMAISLTLLIGTTGQLSLGHAAFFALGAYVAVATLGMGILLGIVLRNEQKLSGGPDGMPVVSLEWFGNALSERAWYWVFLAVLVLVYAGATNLLRSPAGRALRSLHDAEIAAQTCGVNTDAYKVRVFVLSCALAGLMGAFYAHYTAFLTPSATSIVRSLEYVMMAVIGGIGSLTGAIVGALIVTMLPQVLSGMERYETLLVGSILLGSILLLPAGIVPSLGKLRQRFIRSMDK